ncbi:MAG: hypothetical protein JNK32_03360, partial [Anaerolineales bacterium]|nr:hypothetical protein [Anaerolineales bacterium]
FEEDVNVPFLIRGPGIEPNMIVNKLAGNVDIAPTFADMAGVVPPDFVDGRSLLPLFTPSASQPWREAYLLERGGDEAETFYWDTTVSRNLDPGLLEPFDVASKPNYTWPFASPYVGLRTEEHCYIEFEIGDIELYNMVNDPHQLENLAWTADPATLEIFSQWVERLKTCAGESCWAAEGKP